MAAKRAARTNPTFTELLAAREALAVGLPAGGFGDFTVTATSISGSLGAWRRLLPNERS